VPQVKVEGPQNLDFGELNLELASSVGVVAGADDRIASRGDEADLTRCAGEGGRGLPNVGAATASAGSAVGQCCHRARPDRKRQANGVQPRTWLINALGRIADHKITRIHELLPWRNPAAAA
jgi:hypothetical protein